MIGHNFKHFCTKLQKKKGYGGCHTYPTNTMVIHHFVICIGKSIGTKKTLNYLEKLLLYLSCTGFKYIVTKT